MIISVTEIGVFKRCRLLWDFSSNKRQNLVPVQEAPYFFTGRMVHQTLEEWTQRPEDNIEALWAKTLAREIDFYKQRYHDVIGAQPSEAEIDVVMERALLPFEMTRNYKKHWKTPLPEDFTLVQTEQTCIADIPTLENFKCADGSIGVKLEGTLDGFVYNAKLGRLFVLERKTYERRPQIEILDSNEQFTGYDWLLRLLFPSYEIGGVLYDGLWKREAPTRGKTFDDLFFRHLVLKDNDELDRYEENLIRVATDMASAPLIYPNRVWQGCHDDSQYEKLCLAMMKNDDFDYMRDTYFGKKSTKAYDAYESDLI